MRLGDLMRDILERVSPAAAAVKREATRNDLARRRAILVRQTVERELGISFQAADGHYAREARR